MSYRLVVTKEESNPNYVERPRSNWNDPQESPTRTVRTLEILLTDEEFAAVKKACLEVMK